MEQFQLREQGRNVSLDHQAIGSLRIERAILTFMRAERHMDVKTADRARHEKNLLKENGRSSMSRVRPCNRQPPGQYRECRQRNQDCFAGLLPALLLLLYLR